MTQAQQIQRHLEKGKSINPLQALEKYGCFRLAARIADLRNQGLNIKTTIIKLKNNKHIATYSMN